MTTAAGARLQVLLAAQFRECARKRVNITCCMLFSNCCSSSCRSCTCYLQHTTVSRGEATGAGAASGMAPGLAMLLAIPVAFSMAATSSHSCRATDPWAVPAAASAAAAAAAAQGRPSLAAARSLAAAHRWEVTAAGVCRAATQAGGALLMCHADDVICSCALCHLAADCKHKGKTPSCGHCRGRGGRFVPRGGRMDGGRGRMDGRGMGMMGLPAGRGFVPRGPAPGRGGRGGRFFDGSGGRGFDGPHMGRGASSARVCAA